MNQRGPIFIGGLSHSGKTEMRMILERHPDVTMVRRTTMWARFYGAFGDLQRSDNLERCLSALAGAEGLRAFEIDPSRLRREFEAGTTTYPRLFGLIHQQRADRLRKRRWGEQLGMLEAFADPIFESFEQARMIHLIRHPQARYAEAMARSGHRKRGALGADVAEWLNSAGLAERNRRLYPEKYRVIRYEAMAADPVGTTREICSFLAEQPTDEMVELARSIFSDREDSDTPAAGCHRPSPTSPSFESAFVDKYATTALHNLCYPIVDRSRCTRGMSAFPIHWSINRMTMGAWRVAQGRNKNRLVRSS